MARRGSRRRFLKRGTSEMPAKKERGMVRPLVPPPGPVRGDRLALLGAMFLGLAVALRRAFAAQLRPA